MDNNQQVGDTVAAGTNGPVQMSKDSGGSHTSTDLNLNNPETMNVSSPITGQDVSMTVPQYAGGNITTTEAGSK